MENEFNFDCEQDLLCEDEIAKAARENFGIKYMYPWQRLVAANILEAYEWYKKKAELDSEELQEFEKDSNDSFCKGRQIVLLPTGAGKSLCFQIPALLLDGPTLVIYPLLALMTDQQRRMEEGSLRSVTFRGGQSEEERRENFEKLKNGAKIIIANPEVLAGESLLERLKAVGIKHIAIDEAHCVSEWGDSFRPAYLELGRIIKALNPPVITAFTATASPSVLQRISEILFDGEAHLVRSDSDRPNIHYYVRYAAVKKKEALYLAQTELHPMIIFCGTRNAAEDMAQELNVCFGKGTSRFYHAGLEKSEKETVEKWFYESETGILCATCAYGMGVDKKNIKTVVHIEAPATAEAYIQEAGRGGRDGSIAKAILLWSISDSLKFRSYAPASREAAMGAFAETTECRRQVLLDALGAEKAYCEGCDLCQTRAEDCAIGDGIARLHGAAKILAMARRRWKEECRNSQKKSDWETACSLIKKARNYYTEAELEEALLKKMNSKSMKKIGKKIWNHTDVVEIMNQLLESGKIIPGGILWKGKLQAQRSPHRRFAIRQPLHRHRHLHLRQAPGLEQLQA